MFGMLQAGRLGGACVAVALAIFAGGSVCGCHGQSVGDGPSSGTDATDPTDATSGDATPTIDALDSTLGPPDTFADAPVDVADADTRTIAPLDGDDGCGPHKGASMVRVTTPTGTFCIDATETTNREYNAFLADPPPFNPQPKGCEGHSSWGTTTTDASLLDVARDKTTWCDAFAYCKWSGKQLCGHIGDGALQDLTTYNDMNKAAWVWACMSGDAANAYPFGASWDPRVCNSGEALEGVDAGTPTVKPPKSYPDCHGFGAPYDRIFDLAGNVNEWVSACETDDFGYECGFRGGGVGTMGGNVYELCANGGSAPPQWEVGGIRCCK